MIKLIKYMGKSVSETQKEKWVLNRPKEAIKKKKKKKRDQADVDDTGEFSVIHYISKLGINPE